MAYPSTFLDLQNTVAAKSRMDTTDSTQLSKIKDFINRAYTEICVSTECLQDSDTITLTANTGSYTIPSAVSRIKQMVIKQTGTNAYNRPLTLVDLASILRWRQSNGGQAVTNGTAYYYSVSGLNDLDLFPTPASADTLLMYYSAVPTPLSADADVPQIPEPYATECIESGALVSAFDYMKDFISSNTIRQVYSGSVAEFRQHLRRREGGQTKQFAKTTGLYRPPHDPSVDVGASYTSY